MKLKSSNEVSLLRTVGWLTVGVFCLIAGGWFMQHNQHSTDTSSSSFSTIVPKDELKKNITKKTFREVIDAHRDETILLSVKDEASKNFTDNYRALIRNIGGDELADLSFREAYTGVIHKGRFIEEQSSKTETLSAAFNIYQVVSAPIPAGNYSLFIIENDTIQRAARGLHAFVLNENGVLTDTYTFDFYGDSQPLSSSVYINPVFEDLPQFTIELSEKKFRKIFKNWIYIN